MNRPPHLCIARKYVSFRATEFLHPANDLLRCLAMSCTANDNDLRGRR